MKKAVVGILAHVDAGKTTLAESLLYKTGVIRSQGRVDSGNTVLDNHSLERERGITIFSSEAIIETEKIKIFLLDTPGHVDFSAETERTLQVLDYAILVISGLDGIQSHTRTLWRLLELYNIPVFLFITKMDFCRKGQDELISELKKDLDSSCIIFSDGFSDEIYEEIAETDEKALDRYLETGMVNDDLIAECIKNRQLFPCYFGSGLKNEGIDEFICGLEKYITENRYSDNFSATVYKITHDNQGGKLVHLKMTGGRIEARDIVKIKDSEFKIGQIRFYNGFRFSQSDNAVAGDICTVTGLEGAECGMCLGMDNSSFAAQLEPVMIYRLELPDGENPDVVMSKLKLLEEEDPSLNIRWNPALREIHVSLMGLVQAEILKSLIYDRFDINVNITDGHILYKETIKNKVEGVGHYEPLRHYAEVHLILEPLPAGSGLIFENKVRQDTLDINWQRLIMIHLKEKQHCGVLTGTPLTDVKISIAAGRAHLKHTEGGDFRQATYRAVRQGLMQAESVLLEPYYSFILELPSECLGRAIVDIQQMYGTFDTKQNDGVIAIIEGTAPVACMNGYSSVVASYTGGRGRFLCENAGYKECHNSEEVIKEYGYDPEGDLENSPDSVFCAHGSGFTVKWQKVPEYMHIESCLSKNDAVIPVLNKRNFHIDDKELEAIMEREFGKPKTVLYKEKKKVVTPHSDTVEIDKRPECVIVDGYNVIFAWQELKEISSEDLGQARECLLGIMSDYSAFTGKRVVVVFDAYKVKGSNSIKEEYENISIVYTKENELADVYIEKLISEIGKNEKVRVVTSDNLIQLSAIRIGVLRMSASDFEQEVKSIQKRESEFIERLDDKTPKNKIGDSINV